jgi:hypothetical protein
MATDRILPLDNNSHSRPHSRTVIRATTAASTTSVQGEDFVGHLKK